MIKKTVTFEDFNGQTVTEDHFFNLNKTEIFELELQLDSEETGGFSNKLKDIAEKGDPKLIIATFTEIMKKSYGVRSSDGRSFIKRPEAFEEFRYTEAYSEIFFSLITDANAAAEFVTGIMPREIQENAEVIRAKRELAEMSVRERSEAQMQGHKKTESVEPKTITIKGTASPVVKVKEEGMLPDTDKSFNYGDLSREELEVIARRSQGGLNLQ